MNDSNIVENNIVIEDKDVLVSRNKRLAKLNGELLEVSFDIYQNLHENAMRGILEESWYRGLYQVLILDSSNPDIKVDGRIDLLISNAELSKLNNELLEVIFQIFQALYENPKRDELEDIWYSKLHKILIENSRSPL